MTGNAEHFINVLRQAGYYPTSDPPEIDGAEVWGCTTARGQSGIVKLSW